MKRLLALVMTLVLLLVSCGTAEVTTDDGAALPGVYDEKTATELLELLRQSVESEQLTVYVDPLPLTESDAFKYHFFIDANENMVEAAICQPTNSVIPFFLGILKVSSEKAAREIAQDVEDNINYRKLVCTSFEKAHVKVEGKTVFLVLDGDADRADRMLSHFEGLAHQS